MLNEGRQLARSAKYLVCDDQLASGLQRIDAHTRREAQSYANGTSDGTLPGAVRPEYHVHAWPRRKLHEIIGEKVLAANAHDRSRKIAT
jgi:diadenosine tetraphosphate (Ap4A) HIT family hydrolase